MKKRKLYSSGIKLFLLRKILIVMKLTALLILASSTLISASVYSNNTRLTIKHRGITYEELFREIENQTEFRFAYSKSKLNPTTVVKVDAESESLENILAKVLPKEITYEIIDRYVVILNASDKSDDKVPSQQQNQLQSISGHVRDLGGQPLPGVTVVVKGTTI